MRMQEVCRDATGAAFSRQRILSFQHPKVLPQLAPSPPIAPGELGNGHFLPPELFHRRGLSLSPERRCTFDSDLRGTPYRNNEHGRGERIADCGRRKKCPRNMHIYPAAVPSTCLSTRRRAPNFESAFALHVDQLV